MSLSLGIVGAGVVGRMLALKAHTRGWNVTLFERGDESGALACSTVPPAMLAPYCELDVAEKTVADLGAEGLKLWPEILRQFDLDVYFQQQGSLIVAHPQDKVELERFQRAVSARTDKGVFSVVEGEDLKQLEPELDHRFQSGLFFRNEGQIDSRGVMAAMLGAIRQRNIECRFNCEVQDIAPNSLRCGNEALRFDMVLDCRGYGAAKDIPDLRAVRGEIIRVHAPGVHFNRPVRFLHPRWPLYIVPRPDNHYIIGATTIESDDPGPISVRSTLEMLSAAFALHSGFSEARILETNVGLRPAFPDNEPRIQYQPGLIRVNGMYRHGYLLSPVVTDSVCALIEQGKPQADHLFYEAA